MTRHFPIGSGEAPVLESPVSFLGLAARTEGVAAEAHFFDNHDSLDQRSLWTPGRSRFEDRLGYLVTQQLSLDDALRGRFLERAHQMMSTRTVLPPNFRDLSFAELVAQYDLQCFEVVTEFADVNPDSPPAYCNPGDYPQTKFNAVFRLKRWGYYYHVPIDLPQNQLKFLPGSVGRREAQDLQVALYEAVAMKKNIATRMLGLGQLRLMNHPLAAGFAIAAVVLVGGFLLVSPSS